MNRSHNYSVQPKQFLGKIKSYLNGLLDEVSVIEALCEENTLIDVRTAQEYEKGSIPDAFNYPLFDNLERAEIGVIYRKIGKNAAVVKGLEFFEPRIQQFLSSLIDFKSKRIVVFCARGGMRSASVVRLLQYQGFQAAQLQGGYKSFRSYVLRQLRKPVPPLIVLHGSTGVGKTLLLKKLPDHLDLEEFAGHRSSLFGAINKIPQTQKNFEALLAKKIIELPNTRPVFIEGESRKVGKVFIPQSLAEAMKYGTLVLLQASFDTRIRRIVKEYKICDEQTLLKTDSILQSMQKVLGKKKAEQLRQWLRKGEFENIVHVLLEEYYDPRYQHAMRMNEYALKLSAEDLNSAAEKLVRFRNGIVSCRDNFLQTAQNNKLN
ncbi:MAG: tRNA 2-selenouridine(34) synthase MnmH [SAR324 cluster bacterium]|mgnify:FL=1|jgi:tRNA 2-selenouridine synthase|nr:tRNA 2-selenouridine(34) synthase MnmH [SAR324 cluster bacterium]MDP6521280.1 tRNA 2-selenouridine(34) synthase MnmH [SAR324 cluster bacterium]|tara:strand:+ start:1908 stop:3035 length:1128 start_codon:yes stop_codon:yes gene_type:complete